MRRFDYTAYVTPDDPKQRRQQNEGKFRTDASTPLDVAQTFVGDDQHSIEGVTAKKFAQGPAKNKFEFKYRSLDPYPCQVFVEMHEVAEDPTHPLTREGFVAWAEAQVAKNPVVDGKPNTVELELAGVLHSRQVQQLYEQDGSDLREWLADILMDGRTGYAEMTREELLHEIDDDIVQSAGEGDVMVEDVIS
jgi:hypothetical protein